MQTCELSLNFGKPQLPITDIFRPVGPGAPPTFRSMGNFKLENTNFTPTYRKRPILITTSTCVSLFLLEKKSPLL